jgi:hypothetical protein
MVTLKFRLNIPLLMSDWNSFGWSTSRVAWTYIRGPGPPGWRKIRYLDCSPASRQRRVVRDDVKGTQCQGV